MNTVRKCRSDIDLGFLSGKSDSLGQSQRGQESPLRAQLLGCEGAGGAPPRVE